MTTERPAPPSKLVGTSPRGRMKSRALRAARGMWMIERQLRGDTTKQIAADLQLSQRMIEKELKRGKEMGYVERVRDRLIGDLEKVPNVYTTLLDTPAETLHKHSRGYKLKLDAANAMTEGLGIFKKESERTVKNTLAVVAEELAPMKDVGSGSTSDGRVRFQPTDVDMVPTGGPARYFGGDEDDDGA